MLELKSIRCLTWVFLVFANLIFYSCNSNELPATPLVNTTKILNVTGSSAIGGGAITFDNHTEILSRGVCWSINPNPTLSDSLTTIPLGIENFSCSISGLAPNTHYYVKAFCTTIEGTYYGKQQTFTTEPLALITSYVYNATAESAVSGGNIISGDSLYDLTITARGVCWNTSPNPTISDIKTFDGYGKGTFKSVMIGLRVLTKYYVRSYATNKFGTVYGNEVCFTTENGKLNDVDGNVYHYTNIGTQVWMVEDLKTKRYRNGDFIEPVTDIAQWSRLTIGTFAKNADAYGLFYNGYAVKDSRNLAPKGWHIPSDEEWNTLVTYLGGAEVAGGKLKDTDSLRWNSPNDVASYSCGFSALPNGFFIGAGLNFGNTGYWWTSTEKTATSLWFRSLQNISKGISRNVANKNAGYSVRCVRD